VESAVTGQSVAPLLERDWPRGWRAHWIGAEAPAVNRGHEPNFHVTLGGQFARKFFRRGFVLDEVPSTAPLRLTADSRYLLLINGMEVGRGPIRSQPRRLATTAMTSLPCCGPERTP
jgi:alpha-L-rhamnosidase